LPRKQHQRWAKFLDEMLKFSFGDTTHKNSAIGLLVEANGDVKSKNVYEKTPPNAAHFKLLREKSPAGLSGTES
jgi:hypothetical protein